MNLEIVSYSEIDTYRQCRLKHQLAYVEKWRTDETADALARGTLFHSVMEGHYNKIKEIGREDLEAIDLWMAVRHLLYDPDTGEQSEMQELVEWMYRGYVDHYTADPDWEIVDVERPITYPLLWPDGGESGFALSGTVDLVVIDKTIGPEPFIVDHKTCRDLPKQKDFDMEDQTPIYTHLLKQSGANIRGAWYNYVRTRQLVRPMTADERFLRHLTVRTDEELQTIAADALEIMEEAYYNHRRRVSCDECGGTGVDYVVFDSETGERESPDCPKCGGSGEKVYDAPRTPDGERCGWRCGFTEACIAGRKYGPDRTRTFLEDTGFSRRDTKPGPTFQKKAEA